MSSDDTYERGLEFKIASISVTACSQLFVMSKFSSANDFTETPLGEPY